MPQQRSYSSTTSKIRDTSLLTYASLPLKK
jgi:hypothetical protein